LIVSAGKRLGFVYIPAVILGAGNTPFTGIRSQAYV